jgi:flagellar export protein FliJ
LNSVERLQILAQVSQRLLDRTLSKLSELSARSVAEQQKLDYLRTVANEYQSRSLVFTQQAFDLGRLQRQQQFAERLKAAIEEQSGRCRQLEQDLLSIQHLALLQRRKIMTVKKLIARQNSLASVLVNRAEQRQSDEFAAGKHSTLESLTL